MFLHHLSSTLLNRVLEYLNPNEELRYLARPHLAQLRWEIVIWVSAAAFSIGAIGLRMPELGGLVLVAATMLVTVNALQLWETCYAITDKRVLVLTGATSDTLVDVPIELVIDVKYERTLLGHLLDYGDFELNLSGRPSFRQLRSVAEPRLVYQILTRRRAADDPLWPPAFGEATRSLVVAGIGIQQGIARCEGHSAAVCAHKAACAHKVEA